MAKKFEKKKTDKKQIDTKEGAIRIAKTVGGIIIGVVSVGLTIATGGKFKGSNKL